MRIKNIAIIVVVVILVCAIGVGAYYMLQPGHSNRCIQKYTNRRRSILHASTTI